MKKNLLKKQLFVGGLVAATVLSFAGDAQAKVWFDHNGINDVAIETSQATGSVVTDINLTHKNLDINGNVEGSFHPVGEDENCEISADKLTIGQIAAVKDILVANDKAIEGKAKDALDAADAANTKADAANTKADAANTKADAANTKADAANTKADAANTKADAANTKADAANTKADSALEQIAKEVKDRKDADDKLQDNIDKEAAAREAADDKLQANIDAEEEARIDGDNKLNEKINREVSRLDNRIDKLDDRIEKVGAMSAAIANLHTMGYDPAAPTEIAVGVGQYRDKTGLAVGAFHYPNRDFMMSFSVSTAGDEFMAGIGATWKIGRKSPEQMLKAQQEKAARERLAEAEAMKQAAKDARVAAQQARHAKMLAERSK